MQFAVISIVKDGILDRQFILYANEQGQCLNGQYDGKQISECAEAEFISTCNSLENVPEDVQIPNIGPSDDDLDNGYYETKDGTTWVYLNWPETV